MGMEKLFEPFRLGDLKLDNRFVRSATWLGLAGEDGRVTDELIRAMEALAGGQVGLIVTGHAYVSPEGQASPRQLGVWSDNQVEGLCALTEAVHRLGGKIVLQLAHAGIFARTRLTGRPALAVSAVEGFDSSNRRIIGEKDIERLKADFIAAARRAVQAGFDGIQLHAAHGYLLGQFISPLFNRRTDSFGGGIAGRTSFCRAIVAEIRRFTGPDFPVLVKLNCNDLAPGGLVPEQAVKVAGYLASGGVTAIEISGGLPRGKGLSPTWTGIDSPDKEAYFRSEAALFRKQLDIPLILVGGIRSFEVAGRLLEGGLADLVSMARPFICEPDLVARWHAGDRRPSCCRSDNLCFRPGLAGKGVHCVRSKRSGSNGGSCP